MKGQNLAVETVFTVGLGIALATGVVTVFDQYQSEVSSTAADKQAQIAASRIKTAIYRLESVDRAEVMVPLPNEIGSQDYTVVLKEGITVKTGMHQYSYPLNGVSERVSISGSASGGTAKLFKTENQITLSEE